MHSPRLDNSQMDDNSRMQDVNWSWARRSCTKLINLRKKTGVKKIVSCHIRDYLPFLKKKLFPLVKNQLHLETPHDEGVVEFTDLIEGSLTRDQKDRPGMMTRHSFSTQAGRPASQKVWSSPTATFPKTFSREGPGFPPLRTERRSSSGASPSFTCSDSPPPLILGFSTALGTFWFRFLNRRASWRRYTPTRRRTYQPIPACTSGCYMIPASRNRSHVSEGLLFGGCAAAAGNYPFIRKNNWSPDMRGIRSD